MNQIVIENNCMVVGRNGLITGVTTVVIGLNVIIIRVIINIIIGVNCKKWTELYCNWVESNHNLSELRLNWNEL